MIFYATRQRTLPRDHRAVRGDPALPQSVTDITEIKTYEGKLFVCVVVDLFSNLVIGWTMHHRQDRHMVMTLVLTVRGIGVEPVLRWELMTT